MAQISSPRGLYIHYVYNRSCRRLVKPNDSTRYGCITIKAFFPILCLKNIMKNRVEYFFNVSLSKLILSYLTGNDAE